MGTADVLSKYILSVMNCSGQRHGQHLRFTTVYMTGGEVEVQAKDFYPSVCPSAHIFLAPLSSPSLSFPSPLPPDPVGSPRLEAASARSLSTVLNISCLSAVLHSSCFTLGLTSREWGPKLFRHRQLRTVTGIRCSHVARVRDSSQQQS